MLRALAPPRPSRAARRARRALAASAALVALATVAAAFPLLVNEPSAPSLLQTLYVERDGDYVAWATVGPSPMRHVSVAWSANGSVDRVLLLRQGDVARLVAGEDVQPIRAFEPDMRGPRSMGRADFLPPAADCPPPTGGCVPASMGVLVWVKGDAWRGMDATQPRFSTNEQAFPGLGEWTHGGGWGPVSYGKVEGAASTVPFTRAMEVLALVGALLVLAAAAWWALVEARAPPAPAPRLGAPAGASTEEMLGLVRLASLYVEGIGRSFLASGVAIAAGVALAMWLGLPPTLRAAHARFAYMPDEYARAVALFLGAPLVVGAAALVAWGVSYLRVRRELRAWRDLSDRFDAEAARVLGA